MVSFEYIVTPTLPTRCLFTFGLVSCSDAGKSRPVSGVTPACASVRPAALALDPARMPSDYFLNLPELIALLVHCTIAGHLSTCRCRCSR